MRFLNTAEIKFFKEQYAKDVAAGIGDSLPVDRRKELAVKYREAFPNSERSEAGICTQWYCAKRKIYSFSESKSPERVRKNSLQGKLNFSRVKGCDLDNIIIDLIDCVSIIKEENEKLRKFRDAIVAVKV